MYILVTTDMTMEEIIAMITAREAEQRRLEEEVLAEEKEEERKRAEEEEKEKKKKKKKSEEEKKRKRQGEGRKQPQKVVQPEVGRKPSVSLRMISFSPSCLVVLTWTYISRVRRRPLSLCPVNRLARGNARWRTKAKAPRPR